MIGNPAGRGRLTLAAGEVMRRLAVLSEAGVIDLQALRAPQRKLPN
jgi:hypothetical protein